MPYIDWLKSHAILVGSIAFALVATAGVGCGSGGGDGPGWDNGRPGGDPATSGGHDPADDEADPGVVRAGADDAGTSKRSAGDAGSSSSSSGSGSGGSGSGGGSTIACDAPGTCANARSSGQIAGDMSGAAVPVTVHGATSSWVRVRVLEDEHGVKAVPISVQATLYVPAGASYALTLYVDGDNDDVACTSAAPTTTSNGTATSALPAVVSATWGESGTFANNSDDSRWVSLHVDATSSVCSDTTPWTLVIENVVR